MEKKRDVHTVQGGHRFTVCSKHAVTYIQW